MKQIQGKSALLRVRGKFELPRVRVIGVQLYFQKGKATRLLPPFCVSRTCGTTTRSVSGGKDPSNCLWVGKKIHFSQNPGNAAQVHKAICEAFPALEEGGGYEILPTGDGQSKDFILIP